MAEVYDIQDTEGQNAISVSRARAKHYEDYERYYRNEDGLYTELGKFMGNAVLLPSRVQEHMRSHNLGYAARSSVESLRNPVPRIVEFYSDVLLTGDLEEAFPLKSDPKEDDSNEERDSLKEAILKVWEWSNLQQQKQVLKRFTALYGQCWLKVVRPAGKGFCYLQIIRPQHVTAFEEDERGNITYIRLDIPDVEEVEGREKHIWRSEVWRKGEDENDAPRDGEAIFATTERRNADTVPSEKRLREAAGAKGVKKFSELHGADFVPFVTVNAADTGEDRPAPVYSAGLQLVDWINREATRLSDLFFRFNKAFKGVVGIGNDARGRPMAPPKPEGVRDLGAMYAEQQGMQQGAYTQMQGGERGAILSRQNENISIEGVAVIGLPGDAQMVDLAPNINYAAAVQWLDKHLRELYEECPELLYYAVEGRANQSGSALRTLLAGAVHRAEEMRSNILSALVKADKMTLTVAQEAGFPDFSATKIGTYEGGGFEHSFDPPEIFPASEDEREAARTKKLENVSKMLTMLEGAGVTVEKRQEILLSELGLEEVVGDEIEEPPRKPTPPQSENGEEVDESGSEDTEESGEPSSSRR